MGWSGRKRGDELYHHVYAWGNDRHPVFKKEPHYEYYLSILGAISSFYKVDIIAYALMKWHVHLFVFDRINKIADFMMTLHGNYAQYYNRQCNRTGHVFGKRYDNKVVTNSVYGMWLSRYIHRQALEAGLVLDPAVYPWTSYRRYLGKEPTGFLQHNVIMEMFGPGPGRIKNYREFVLGSDDGPVDWGHHKMKILDGRHILGIVAGELDIDPAIIIAPRGRVERTLRRKAAIWLIQKHGLNTCETARILNMSPSAVSKFIKTALL